MGATAKKPRAKKAPAIPAIKGMDHAMKCRGFQFESGKTYEVKGKIVACKNGFHSCPVDGETSPLSVFEYYAPGLSRYFEVEASGETDRQDSKIASAKLTVGVEVSVGELTRRFVDWVIGRAKPTGAASNSGYQGAASNSGDQGAASNSGTQGAASNSGDYGAASNSGDYGAASNSGTRGAASNSGTRGAASNSGARGAASNSGTYGAAFSHAYGGKVMCEGDDQALYCTEFADDGSIASVACGITGRDGIEAGVWYVAKAGKLVRL